MSYCPLCGSPLQRSVNNFGLVCLNPDCQVRGSQAYPKPDDAAPVVTVDEATVAVVDDALLTEEAQAE